MLAIDGGGILGLTTAIYLRALQDAVGRPLGECFDVVVGTSTGSILASAIGANIPIDRVVRLYQERGREIFPGETRRFFDSLGRVFSEGVSRPKYGDRGLGNALREELSIRSRPVQFKDFNPKVMLTAYDTITRRAWVFKSWRSWMQDHEVWEFVKGSCSAPTYFPAHTLSIKVPDANRNMVHRRFALIDGGVWANNPSAVGLAEALRLNREAATNERVDPDEFVVASFGNIENAGKPIDARNAEEWGALEWVKEGDLISVMMDGAQETAAYICESVVPKDRFHRFGLLVNDGEEHQMDDASPAHIAELVELADSYIRLPDVVACMQKVADQIR